MKFFSEEGRELCDCEDTFLYHVSDNFCYDAYRQGPCSIGHYFILPPGEALATCEKNPCDIDGLVPFNGKCHFLWKSGNPCKDNNTYLGINKEFQIECGSSKYLGSIDRLVNKKKIPQIFLKVFYFILISNIITFFFRNPQNLLQRIPI